ncbi:zinc finger C3HC4-type RING finger family protein, partial [Prunus dulcis]
VGDSKTTYDSKNLTVSTKPIPSLYTSFSFYVLSYAFLLRKRRTFPFHSVPPRKQQKMARREEEPKQSPRDPKVRARESSDPVKVVSNGTSGDSSMFSPRFKSVAAMAGWDEESLLIASLVVDDTPERQVKYKKRSDLHFKTHQPIHQEESAELREGAQFQCLLLFSTLMMTKKLKKMSGKEKEEPQIIVNKEKETRDDKMAESSGVSCPPSSNLPCLDKLRDELSCAICLEICFEPSTTPCGHSFCKKCLRSAADKCGKRCPKCRQLMSHSRSCTVNTVLWNTIQLLFPQEVEARKAAGALNSSGEAVRQIPEKAFYNTRSVQSRRASSGVSSNGEMTMRRRRVILSQDEEDDDAALAIRLVQNTEAEHQNPEQGAHRSIRPLRTSSSRRIPSQDGDAALALRLQREEFMEAFRVDHGQSGSSLSLARANLRAMTSRATSHRATTRHL